MFFLFTLHSFLFDLRFTLFLFIFFIWLISFLYLLFTWVYIHCVHNIIINYPYIIFIVSCYRFSCVCPTWFIVILNLNIILLIVLNWVWLNGVLNLLLFHFLFGRCLFWLLLNDLNNLLLQFFFNTRLLLNFLKGFCFILNLGLAIFDNILYVLLLIMWFLHRQQLRLSIIKDYYNLSNYISQ